MAKFKVGDRVKYIGRVILLSYTNQTARVIEIGDVPLNYRIQFDMPRWPDDGRWYVEGKDLELITPAIPPGWTSADEPPDNSRKVRVLTPDGLYDGLHLVVFGEYAWRLFSGNTTAAHYAAPGEVLAWREIEPAAKPAAQVRYAVTYKGEGDSYDFDDENCYSTLESATQAAKRQSVDANKPAEIWKLVAIVNPPAEPEVIRMEE